MKENIATIPLMNAFGAKDECPFCYLEREAEQHAVSFILGSAYMEDDIRMQTDATGFCRHHYKMMYDYGNRPWKCSDLKHAFKKVRAGARCRAVAFYPGQIQPVRAHEAHRCHRRSRHTAWCLDCKKDQQLLCLQPFSPDLWALP